MPGSELLVSPHGRTGRSQASELLLSSAAGPLGVSPGDKLDTAGDAVAILDASLVGSETFHRRRTCRRRCVFVVMWTAVMLTAAAIAVLVYEIFNAKEHVLVLENRKEFMAKQADLKLKVTMPETTTKRATTTPSTTPASTPSTNSIFIPYTGTVPPLDKDMDYEIYDGMLAVPSIVDGQINHTGAVGDYMGSILSDYGSLVGDYSDPQVGDSATGRRRRHVRDVSGGYKTRNTIQQDVGGDRKIKKYSAGAGSYLPSITSSLSKAMGLLNNILTGKTSASRLALLLGMLNDTATTAAEKRHSLGEKGQPSTTEAAKGTSLDIATASESTQHSTESTRLRSSELETGTSKSVPTELTQKPTLPDGLQSAIDKNGPVAATEVTMEPTYINAKYVLDDGSISNSTENQTSTEAGSGRTYMISTLDEDQHPTEPASMGSIVDRAENISRFNGNRTTSEPGNDENDSIVSRQSAQHFTESSSLGASVNQTGSSETVPIASANLNLSAAHGLVISINITNLVIDIDETTESESNSERVTNNDQAISSPEDDDCAPSSTMPSVFDSDGDDLVASGLDYTSLFPVDLVGSTESLRGNDRVEASTVASFECADSGDHIGVDGGCQDSPSSTPGSTDAISEKDGSQKSSDLESGKNASIVSESTIVPTPGIAHSSHSSHDVTVGTNSSQLPWSSTSDDSDFGTTVMSAGKRSFSALPPSQDRTINDMESTVTEQVTTASPFSASITAADLTESDWTGGGLKFGSTDAQTSASRATSQPDLDLIYTTSLLNQPDTSTLAADIQHSSTSEPYSSPELTSQSKEAVTMPASTSERPPIGTDEIEPSSRQTTGTVDDIIDTSESVTQSEDELLSTQLTTRSPDEWLSSSEPKQTTEFWDRTEVSTEKRRGENETQGIHETTSIPETTSKANPSGDPFYLHTAKPSLKPQPSSTDLHSVSEKPTEEASRSTSETPEVDATSASDQPTIGEPTSSASSHATFKEPPEEEITLAEGEATSASGQTMTSPVVVMRRFGVDREGGFTSSSETNKGQETEVASSTGPLHEADSTFEFGETTTKQLLTDPEHQSTESISEKATGSMLPSLHTTERMRTSYGNDGPEATTGAKDISTAPMSSLDDVTQGEPKIEELTTKGKSVTEVLPLESMVGNETENSQPSHRPVTTSWGTEHMDKGGTTSAHPVGEGELTTDQTLSDNLTTLPQESTVWAPSSNKTESTVLNKKETRHQTSPISPNYNEDRFFTVGHTDEYKTISTTTEESVTTEQPSSDVMLSSQQPTGFAGAMNSTESTTWDTTKDYQQTYTVPTPTGEEEASTTDYTYEERTTPEVNQSKRGEATTDHPHSDSSTSLLGQSTVDAATINNTVSAALNGTESRTQTSFSATTGEGGPVSFTRTVSEEHDTKWNTLEDLSTIQQSTPVFEPTNGVYVPSVSGNEVKTSVQPVTSSQDQTIQESNVTSEYKTTTDGLTPEPLESTESAINGTFSTKTSQQHSRTFQINLRRAGVGRKTTTKNINVSTPLSVAAPKEQMTTEIYQWYSKTYQDNFTEVEVGRTTPSTKKTNESTIPEEHLLTSTELSTTAEYTNSGSTTRSNDSAQLTSALFDELTTMTSESTVDDGFLFETGTTTTNSWGEGEETATDWNVEEGNEDYFHETPTSSTMNENGTPTPERTNVSGSATSTDKAVREDSTESVREASVSPQHHRSKGMLASTKQHTGEEPLVTSELPVTMHPTTKYVPSITINRNNVTVIDDILHPDFVTPSTAVPFDQASDDSATDAYQEPDMTFTAEMPTTASGKPDRLMTGQDSGEESGEKSQSTQTHAQMSTTQSEFQSTSKRPDSSGNGTLDEVLTQEDDNVGETSAPGGYAGVTTSRTIGDDRDLDTTLEKYSTTETLGGSEDWTSSWSGFVEHSRTPPIIDGHSSVSTFEINATTEAFREAEEATTSWSNFGGYSRTSPTSDERSPNLTVQENVTTEMISKTGETTTRWSDFEKGSRTPPAPDEHSSVATIEASATTEALSVTEETVSSWSKSEEGSRTQSTLDGHISVSTVEGLATTETPSETKETVSKWNTFAETSQTVAGILQTKTSVEPFSAPTDNVTDATKVDQTRESTTEYNGKFGVDDESTTAASQSKGTLEPQTTSFGMADWERTHETTPILVRATQRNQILEPSEIPIDISDAGRIQGSGADTNGTVDSEQSLEYSTSPIGTTDTGQNLESTTGLADTYNTEEITEPAIIVNISTGTELTLELTTTLDNATNTEGLIESTESRLGGKDVEPTLESTITQNVTADTDVFLELTTNASVTSDAEVITESTISHRSTTVTERILGLTTSSIGTSTNNQILDASKSSRSTADAEGMAQSTTPISRTIAERIMGSTSASVTAKTEQILGKTYNKSATSATNTTVETTTVMATVSKPSTYVTDKVEYEWTGPVVRRRNKHAGADEGTKPTTKPLPLTRKTTTTTKRPVTKKTAKPSQACFKHGSSGAVLATKPFPGRFPGRTLSCSVKNERPAWPASTATTRTSS
ncbi:mucin-5AC-like [Amphibalanus amphitrite]|uniref:mucin-5AC-like n=1 Tax=Amphibalanus amphitrite TaxID=1232801 RepID=UPI001C9225F3|nr:mucin-5AC-like [Amphibalanus amphitrite]